MWMFVWCGWVCVHATEARLVASSITVGLEITKLILVLIGLCFGFICVILPNFSPSLVNVSLAHLRRSLLVQKHEQRPSAVLELDVRILFLSHANLCSVQLVASSSDLLVKVVSSASLRRLVRRLWPLRELNTRTSPRAQVTSVRNNANIQICAPLSLSLSVPPNASETRTGRQQKVNERCPKASKHMSACACACVCPSARTQRTRAQALARRSPAMTGQVCACARHR